MLHFSTPPWAVGGDRGLDIVLLGDPGNTQHGPAFVRSLPDNEELLLPLQADGFFAGRPRWRGHVPWDSGNALTLYCFVLPGTHGHRWLAADGEHGAVPAEAMHFRQHPWEAPPLWVREQVFYQVFPDRFARAEPPLPGVETCLPWGQPPPRDAAALAFFGGDLVGLRQRLPYLQDELGVTALLLNPVFDSPSNHGYDTRDYGRVASRLGGDAALRDLLEATRARGMRVVLDGVVNHTGEEHPWAGDPPTRHHARDESGARAGWKGHAHLPVLDFAQPAVQQAIYGAPDAVLRRWLQPPWCIDGWRLDVVHMLGEGRGARHNAQHVRAMRSAIRSENPEAYVLGEHFSDATRWLQGDQEDGAMNYHGFTRPVRGWLAGLDVGGQRAALSTDDFVLALARAVAPIPYANQLAQLNLLDSHDTPRLLTELGGAPGGLARLMLAFTLLFTRPGVPCIYYGDEIGLEGGADPDCRRCFEWERNHWSEALWRHVQRLAALRQQRAEWRQGAVLPLGHGKDWLAFARTDGLQATVVALNRGPAIDVDLSLFRVPVPLSNWSELPLMLHLPKASSRLLFTRQEPPPKEG